MSRKLDMKIFRKFIVPLAIRPDCCFSLKNICNKFTTQQGVSSQEDKGSDQIRTSIYFRMVIEVQVAFTQGSSDLQWRPYLLSQKLVKRPVSLGPLERWNDAQRKLPAGPNGPDGVDTDPVSQSHFTVIPPTSFRSLEVVASPSVSVA